MTPILHPPYSPNLALSDIFVCLFPQMKKVLKGKHFAMEEVKQKKNGRSPEGIKIEFKNCFEQWKKHLDRCIASNGEYFAGD